MASYMRSSAKDSAKLHQLHEYMCVYLDNFIEGQATHSLSTCTVNTHLLYVSNSIYTTHLQMCALCFVSVQCMRRW